MAFQIIRNDLTKVRADAIVNTANPKPMVGGGLDSAIYLAAGIDALIAERRKIGDIARGQAAYTHAFALEAKYIIHTVGPVWQGGEMGEFDILRACYVNSLELALKLECSSIAFPLIATGIYGFPKDKALQIAMSVFNEFLLQHEMDIILVVFDRREFVLSGKVFEKVTSYVDENYVDETLKKEYRLDSRSMDFAEGNASVGRNYAPRYDGAYGNLNLDSEITLDAEESFEECRPEVMPAAEAVYEARSMQPSYTQAPQAPKPSLKSFFGDRRKSTASSPTKTQQIEDMLKNADKELSFQEKLFELIDATGLSDSQVYNNYVTRQVFSKIRMDRDYQPSKYTAIALALALHLDVNQMLDLIGRAGWTLSPSNKVDLVVKGCVLAGEYNITQIDLYLFNYGLPELRKIK